MSIGTRTSDRTRTSNGTRAVDELRVVVAQVARALRRRLPETVLGAAVLVTVLAGFALAGAAVDDHAIAANKAVAQADVLAGSTSARTLVRFTVANGESVVPELGVYYPAGVTPGGTVAVEYDLTDPERVRVAGRSAPDGVVPLGSVVFGAWVVLGPLAGWLRRRRATVQ